MQSVFDVGNSIVELKQRVNIDLISDETSPLIKQSDAVDSTCQNYINEINSINCWADISLALGASQFVLATSKLGISIYYGVHPIDALTAQTFATMGLSYGLGLGAKIVLNKLERVWQS